MTHRKPKIFPNSKDTGIAASTINNLCNNKTLSIQPSVLQKICDTLDCEASDILKRDIYIN